MDKKKLFGTILGVTAAAALIAGATFAWLIVNINVTNGVYNSGVVNFAVSYTNGTAINAVPILDSPTTGNTSSLNVKANKAADSIPGNLTITLNTTSTELAAGALNYAVCIGPCSNEVAADLTQSANKGTIAGVGSQNLITTPLTANQTTYNIYFWLDPAKVNGGEAYSGYISASALQQ